MQYLNDYDSSSAVDHNRTMAWNYKAHYTALFSDDQSSPTFGMAGGTVEGSVLSYKASDGTRTNVHTSGSITKRTNTGRQTIVVKILFKYILILVILISKD